MRYTDEHLQEIRFPLGGIGTGSISLAGNGALMDWEIFNRPNKGSTNGYSFFAVKAEMPDGSVNIRVLQGDLTKDFMGIYLKDQHLGYGFGPTVNTMCGFPHFEEVVFDGEFPMATLSFRDKNFPAEIEMKAFNPFIPLDEDNSSIPAAFFDITIKNCQNDVKYTLLFSVQNPFSKGENIKVDCKAVSRVGGKTVSRVGDKEYTAVIMRGTTAGPDDIKYGDMTVAVDCPEGVCQEYWYRGRWLDNIRTFWHDFRHGELSERHYDVPKTGDVCSVGASAVLNAGQEERFRFVLSWNAPNNYVYWADSKDGSDKNVADKSEPCQDYVFRNYYATVFENSVASCFYALDNWDMLYKKTECFRKSLHSATLDAAVIDAVSANLSVLKSPTVLRLEDGSFYGWEGVAEVEGSCEGSCTHVWSYVYSLCFLFPELERSLRNTEFRYSTEASGEMHFRTGLPLGKRTVEEPPCLDGQMATIIKIYRDWKLTGDSEWLKDNWDNVKKILEFAWSAENPYEWDRDHDGVLEGRQHHTLDMELFGPSSWLQSMYLAALKGACEMAAFLGDEEKAKEYSKLFEQGYRYTKDNLFNGEYFYHQVDLTRKEYTEHFDCPGYWNEEKGQLKSQIGEGSSIDQMLGQWHANICGLGDIFDKKQCHTALQSMMKHNFKQSFREYVNMWRIFALNDEKGCVICDYPDGCNKPVIPISYSDECMTGFEYAFAGLLISEGFVEEGLEVVRAVRDRFDGKKRNPWNEFECGGHYARSMASFALLPIFSGFEFDLPKGYLGFAPVIDGDFRCMWSVGTAWGDFIRTKNECRIEITSGYLELQSLRISHGLDVKKVLVDGREVPFIQEDNIVRFAGMKVEREVTMLL